MAAIALTNNGVISDAESVTNWTGDTFALEPDIKVEGANSVGCAQTNNGVNDLYYASTFNLAGTHIRLYWNCTYIGNFSPTNPVQVYLSDGTNTDFVTYFTTNSQYGGGWADLIVDTALFTTVNLASITQVGIRVNTTTKPRNVPANVFLDNWRYFNGIEIFSTTTEAVSFQDAAVLDAASVYGAIKDVDGVLFCPAEILIGTTGTQNSNFISSNETIVFPDRLVANALYKLKTQQGTGATNVNISGLVCKTVGGSGAELDFSSSLTSLSVTSSSFIDMGTITITPTVTSPTFEGNSFTNSGTTALSIPSANCNWTTCAGVTLSGSGALSGGQISNTTGTSAVFTPTLSSVTGVTFVDSDNSAHAIELTGAAGSYTWNNTLTTGHYVAGSTGSGVQITGGSITGNEALYIPATTGTFNITVAGGTIPSVATGGAIVNVTANQKTLTISNLKQNTEVRLYSYTDINNPATYTEIAGIENTVNGGSGTNLTLVGTAEPYSVEYTFDAGFGPVKAIIVNHKYLPIYPTFNLQSDNVSYQANQLFDRNYDEGATPFIP